MATNSQINILVLWRTKRIYFQQSVGVLSLDGETVTLYDRECSPVLSAQGEELRAEPVGKAIVRLIGPKDAQHLITGAPTALAQNAKATKLIARFNPIVVPPRFGVTSEDDWNKIWRPATTPSEIANTVHNRTQNAIWRPHLLQLLWSCHVAGKPQAA